MSPHPVDVGAETAVPVALAFDKLDQAASAANEEVANEETGYCTWYWYPGWWCYWSTDGSWWYYYS